MCSGKRSPVCGSLSLIAGLLRGCQLALLELNMMNRINKLHIALLAGVLTAAGCGGGGGGGGVGGGTSTPALAILTMNSSSVDFGDVAVGNTRTMEATFSNTGQSSLTLQQSSIAGASFTASGIGAGVTLDPGQYVTLSISFDPSAAGKANGTITLASSSISAPINFPVSGNGVVGSHSAALNWNSSTSVVVGYNVYRASPSQPFWSKLNSSPVTSTSYTDWDVQAGEPYVFTVTAVSAANVESPLATPAPTTIPTL